MGAWLGRRAAASGLLLAVAAVAAFSLLLLVPGDPVAVALSARGRAEPSAEEVARLRAEWGLDRPAPERFARWAAGALVGDFGRSWRTGGPVGADLAPRAARTAVLACAAGLLLVALSLAWGPSAAARAGRPWDRRFLAATSVLASAPVFVLGLALSAVFSVGLGLLPSAGDETPAHYVLPALTLGLAHAAVPARMLRRGILTEAAKPYAVAARARGASWEDVVGVHALRNAAAPYATLCGLSLRGMLAGSVLVEAVFGVRGVGTYLVDSVGARDAPAVLACVLLFVSVTVVVNFTTDAVCAWIDPRLRSAGGGA